MPPNRRDPAAPVKQQEIYLFVSDSRQVYLGKDSVPWALKYIYEQSHNKDDTMRCRWRDGKSIQVEVADTVGTDAAERHHVDSTDTGSATGTDSQDVEMSPSPLEIAGSMQDRWSKDDFGAA